MSKKSLIKCYYFYDFKFNDCLICFYPISLPLGNLSTQKRCVKNKSDIYSLLDHSFSTQPPQSWKSQSQARMKLKPLIKLCSRTKKNLWFVILNFLYLADLRDNAEPFSDASKMVLSFFYHKRAKWSRHHCRHNF